MNASELRRPPLGCTGTATDAVGAFIVAKGVGTQVHGGHVPVLRHQSLWQRVRQRLGHTELQPASGDAAVVQVLALERSVSGVLADAFTPTLLRAEAESLWELHQSGVVRQMFFRDDRPEAVLLLEVAGPGAAKEALGELPLVRSDLVDFEIVPLRAYPGFARLFG